MKLENFKEVQRLVTQPEDLHTALSQAENMLDSYKQNDETYWCYLSQHSDGSGKGVRMQGCYVGIEIAEATISVLNKKILEVKESLRSFSVEV